MPRRILLAQLPIPPFGIEPVRGNVPLAAAYLQMYADGLGLTKDYEFQILDPRIANLAGDRALVREILSCDPWMVGFSCYLWNIQRTLDLCTELKRRKPELIIVLGGPEITADNEWVLRQPAVDYAVIGEGEQTFCDLLADLQRHDAPQRTIAGLYAAPKIDARLFRDLPANTALNSTFAPKQMALRPLGIIPPPRKPLAKLDPISSPYLTGILDAADERLLLLETIRGCIYDCKFCFYPKSYDDLYFVSRDKILDNLAHARNHEASEVVILDPTLNQRSRFNEFVQMLADCNREQQFSYFGEIRSEGIMPDTAKLLKQANFTEVEIGLQSIDPLAMELMDRNNNLKSFERAAGAMLDLGIKVKVDLIIGLPGDTVDSVRRSLDYIHSSGLYTTVQVFNLAILPGTAFRYEAEQLGLKFQDRPPYYVLETPTLDLPTMVELMDEAQDLFEAEFDPLAEPATSRSELDWNAEPPIPRTRPEELGLVGELAFDADASDSFELNGAADRISQALNVRFLARDLNQHRTKIAQQIENILDGNPHTTLQVTLLSKDAPKGNASESNSVADETLSTIEAACYRQPSYLDRYYSVIPGPVKGAKRVVIGREKGK